MRCPGCNNSPIVGAVPASDGSSNWVECPLCGKYGTPGQYPGGGIFYPYQVNFSLTSAVPVPQTITIRKSNDFLWQAAIATRGGTFLTLITINQVQFQTVYSGGIIQQTGGLFDTNFWGTNANPFPLFTPIPMRANDAVTFTLTDTSGATALAPNNVSLFLMGANFDSGTFSQPTVIKQNGGGQ